MSADTVSAVLVEDEPEARRSLREYLRGIDWIEIAGEAADGRTAVEMIDRLKPDLVLLDVQLPEMTGLRVLESVRHAPEVVFTTAYDQYAVAAFEIGALDYLVKPFGRERILKTAERLRQRMAAAGVPASERARAAFASGPLARLFARRGDRIVPILARDIRRIEAQGDYAEVHTPAGAKHTIVGAGSGCVVIAVGARDRSVGPDWGGYTVDETALRQLIQAISMK